MIVNIKYDIIIIAGKYAADIIVSENNVTRFLQAVADMNRTLIGSTGAASAPLISVGLS